MLCALATVLSGAAQVAWMVLLATTIDRAFTDGADVGDLAGLLVTMAALLLARAAALWAVEASAQACSNRLRGSLRDELAGSLVASNPRRLGASALGEASGTLTDGVELMGDYAARYLPALFSVLSLPPMVALAITLLDPPTLAILLFTGPMLVLLLAVIGRRTAELTRRRFEELGWLRGFFLDMVAGLGTLKAFDRSSDGAEVIEDTSRRFGDTTMEVLRTAFQTSLVMEWASTAATALVAVQVSFRMVEGQMPFGTALAVLVLTPEFFVAFRRLSTEYHAGQSGDAAATSIEAHLSAGAEVATDTGRAQVGQERSPSRSAPAISFEDVTYSYPGSPTPALAGLDLHIGSGETVAIVGESGAGKTTATSLLLGFAAAQRGAVRVDGVDLADLEPRAWRRSLAWVPQRPTLFAGTVAENIALGEPDADPQRMELAAAAAGLDGVIDQLDHGYGTRLGEGGESLSGGQRQRIAIARAFLRDAPLVILDEFTTHLDPDVESAVLATARSLLANRTALVVAHRVQTARTADRIAVLHGGRVVEAGTHEELMGARGRWYSMNTRHGPVQA